MRELLGVHQPSRIKGRDALTQRLVRLLLAVHRFGRHRARTDVEIQWTARLIDRLQQALDEARHDGRSV